MTRIRWKKGETARVRDIMTRDVATVSAAETLEHAARCMWERDCGVVPVLEGDRVVGMVTDRDCCMAAYTRGRRLDEIRVDEAMAHQIMTCSPDDTLDRVEERMRQYQIRRMPVIDGDGMVGIISLNDLALATERGQESPTELADTLASISHHRHRPVAAQ